MNTEDRELLQRFIERGERLRERMEDASPDMIQLGIPHRCTVTSEPPDQILGIVFHHEGEGNVSLTVDGVPSFAPRDIKYFRFIQPYQHTPLIPRDGTLCCYFFVRDFDSDPIPVGDLELKIDNHVVPYHYMIPHPEPIEVRDPTGLCSEWIAGGRSHVSRHVSFELHVPSTDYAPNCTIPILVQCEPFRCGVCLEDEDKTQTADLPCGHKVCKVCTEGWFSHRDTCPFCRRVC